MLKLLNKSSLAVLLFITAISVVFISYREYRFHHTANSDLREQADHIAISLWQFDKEVCHNTINFFSKLNSYRTIEVIDYTGAHFTQADTLQLSRIDKFLFKLKLIRLTKISCDIVFTENNEATGKSTSKRIGSLTAEKYNMEIFNYFYVVLVLILLFLIYVAFSNIYQTNSNLEKIVNDKTKRLRQSEEKLLITLNSIVDGVLATDMSGLIVNMNPIAEKILGISLIKCRGKAAHELIHIYNTEDKTPVIQQEKEIISGKLEVRGTLRRAGVEKILTVTLSPIKDILNNSVGTVYVFRDITEKLKAEEQARHSQKMESIGQLAGGIAHDFNNMLGGILGAAELLEIEFDAEKDPDIMENIELIKSSANLAADLTKQLLQFSRKNGNTSKRESVVDLIQSTILLLKRSIDKKIDVTFEKENGRDDFIISCDRAQLQNALLNLGVNARDALQGKGEIKYSVSHVSVSLRDTHIHLPAGEYIKLDVSDNGTGMSDEIKTKIFEPFFTTKDQGKGTGLGLAAVYSTIKEHCGTILVNSIEGVGTTFTIYLPLETDDTDFVHRVEEQTETTKLVKQPQTILLVEDEGLIRTIEIKMLQKQGYTIIEASNGEDAVEIFKKNRESIDVVLMDYIMPRLNGRDAFLQMQEIDPNIRTIIMSGNISEKKINNLLAIGVEGFIKKPFQWNEINALLNHPQKR